MARKEKEEYKDALLPELYKKLDESRRQLIGLRFEAARGEIKNHRQIQQKKKSIARILTAVREKVAHDIERRIDE